MFDEQNLGKSEKAQIHEDLLTMNDRSFPLVCTFDHFLLLLEKTASRMDRQNFSSNDMQYSDRVGHTGSCGPRLIDFRAFCLDYWPNLNRDYIKNLSPHLVFAEILGVIKGSDSSRQSLLPLTRAEYLKRSSRIAPTFTQEHERSRVYEIFEIYEKRKIDKGDIDFVDRVTKILKVARGERAFLQLLRRSFDEIYVDEVQDHRSLDFELFFSIVNNAQGFHFAGDTAQAISQDSTFRFADLKKMHFNHFAQSGKSNSQKRLGYAEMFLLSRNYRSHQGILEIASSVMEMIWKAFPETIDKLEPEVGNLKGPKPVLLIGCDAKILLSNRIASGKMSEQSGDFGAEQVILVRDTDMKLSLEGQIGDVALVFTILESKGMEFDDVILWNFFTGCPDQPGIRALHTMKSRSGFFDSKKHSIMCSELKNLYVAVTRARVQLFIIESSEETAAFAEKLLTNGASEKLVEVFRPGDKDFNLRVEGMRPNTSVSVAGWARRANDLIGGRWYKEAIKAYQKAGDRVGEFKAKAFLKKEEASICDSKQDREGYTRSLEAAHALFIEGGLIKDAVRMLEVLGRWDNAAELCSEHKQFSEAAGLFSRAALYLKASRCHHSAGEFDEAVASLRKGEEYDELASYLNEHREKLSEATFRSCSFLCKLLLKQKKLSANYRDYAIKLLGSSREQEDVFVEYGMNEELSILYKSQQRHEDLFQLYSKNGQLENALALALTKDLLQSSRLVEEDDLLLLLDYSWAGHLIAGTQLRLVERLNLVSSKLTPRMKTKIAEWKDIDVPFRTKDPQVVQRADQWRTTEARRFMCLWKIFDGKTIVDISSLEMLPIAMVQATSDIIADMVLKDDPRAQATCLLVAGFWKPHDGSERVFTLSWSPISSTAAVGGSITKSQIAKRWVMDKFVSAILAMDSQAKELWSERFPSHCVNYLMRGTSHFVLPISLLIQ